MRADNHFWDELRDWRRDFHAHPEFGFGEHRTSRLVAERLRSFGLTDVVEGVEWHCQVGGADRPMAACQA